MVQRLERGEELYRIANLERLWILADLPDDFPARGPGVSYGSTGLEPSEVCGQLFPSIRPPDH
jgi:hypothetical protein